jgi:hypothetical protein
VNHVARALLPCRFLLVASIPTEEEATQLYY